MKRSKRLWVLLGVLAAVCVVTAAVLQMEDRQEQIRESGEVVLSISPDSVDSLSWDYDSETLSFHKDEGWVYDDDEAFPVDDEKIGNLLGEFEEFGAAFIIEEVEDYSQYGLDDPVCTIRLTAGEESWEILLGDYSTMDSQRYVSIGDGNVYLAVNDPLDEFDAALSDLILNDQVPDLDGATRIAFAGEEDYEAEQLEDGSAYSYCADDRYFVSRDGAYLPLDTGKVETYLRSMTNMDLTDYVTYNATQEELESYGLDSPELTVTVDYSYEDEDGETASDTFTLSVSRDPEELAAAQEAEAEAGAEAGEETEEDAAADGSEPEEEITAYARVGDSQIVYQISSNAYMTLISASYDDLRHSEAFPGDFGDITQVDITLDGAQYTLTSQEDGDERSWSCGEEALEIEDFQAGLEALSAYSFTDEEPSQQEEISLTLTLDNESFPQVSIQIYRYDGSYCLAVVDGEPFALVERSAAMDLVESVNAIVLG